MDKYLLEILKDSNTIIIPGLGALTITNKDTGETMFMPYLQHDDGKLAAFIAENDGIDEADAKIMVAKYVREIKAELDKGESYSMFNLGTFNKKDDGDIEFENWSKSAAESKEETPAPVAPVNEEQVIADEPTVEDAPEVEPEPVVEPEIETEAAVEPEPVEEPEVAAEPEAIVEPEPIEEPEEIGEPEPEIIPEAISEPEPSVEPEPVPEVEPEPVVEAEPVAKSDPLEIKEEEIEIRETIEKSLKSAPIIEEMIPEKTTLEPSPLLDDIAPTEAIPHDANFEGEGEEGVESEEDEKKKEKAGIGFWVTMIIIALGIIAGGAYVGRNYNDIKQHIPFLADEDEKADKKSLKDEMSNVIKEDKYSAKSDKRSESKGSASNTEEGFTEEGQVEGTDEGSSETAEVVTPPKPEVNIPEVRTPTPVTVSSTSGGPYKVIAGAFSSEANANKLAAEYKAKGMKSEVFLKGSLHTVSMNSYATSEEANADLPKLRSIAPGAWILYKN